MQSATIRMCELDPWMSGMQEQILGSRTMINLDSPLPKLIEERLIGRHHNTYPGEHCDS